MNENIKIREVEEKDAKTWFKFKNKVWREAYKDIFPEEVFIEKENNVQEKEKSFTDNIYNNNEKIALVAEYKGEIVGLMLGVIKSNYEYFKVDYADLCALYIDPNFQGKRIGSILKNKFEKWAKANGAKKYVIGVLKDNYKARAVYESWGGELSKYEQDFNQLGVAYKEVFYTYDLYKLDELVLEKPDMKHKEQAIKFINEVEQFEPNERIRYSGFSSLQDYKENYMEWLKKIEDYTKKETLPEGKVLSDIFFSVRKSDNKIVGIINIRHSLSDYLYNYGGHIGYCIIPSERRKGYAYKQLLLGLEYCKSIGINKVLITCLDYNIGSSKTIEKSGGELENIVKNKESNETFKRYWISLKK